jgi:hypothetical protein
MEKVVGTNNLHSKMVDLAPKLEWNLKRISLLGYRMTRTKATSRDLERRNTIRTARDHRPPNTVETSSCDRFRVDFLENCPSRDGPYYAQLMETPVWPFSDHILESS